VCYYVVVFNHYCSKGHFEGVTLATEKIPWWWYLWDAETCKKLTNVCCAYFCVCNVGYIN